jgi:hypothetical protein
MSVGFLVLVFTSIVIQRPDAQRNESPTSHRAAREGRAWVLRQLRWEHRLADLRDPQRSTVTSDRAAHFDHAITAFAVAYADQTYRITRGFASRSRRASYPKQNPETRRQICQPRLGDPHRTLAHNRTAVASSASWGPAITKGPNMHVLAYEWGFGEVLWTMLIVFFSILAIWLFVAVVVDIIWRIDLSGWAKAGWLLLLLILPILGALIYLIARPDDLVWWERRRERL